MIGYFLSGFLDKQGDMLGNMWERPQWEKMLDFYRRLLTHQPVLDTRMEEYNRDEDLWGAVNWSSIQHLSVAVGSVK